jgi:UrcA family protein
MKSSSCFVVVLVLAMCAISVPVMATDPLFANQGVRHETVHFSDLNLSNPKGVETLYHRITVASDHVCDEYWSDGTRASLGAVAKAKNCKASAIYSAVANTGNAALLRYYDELHPGVSHPTMVADNTAPGIIVTK